MLLQLFKSLLLQSAIGAILALVLLLLKPVTQRIFGSRWQYYIWLGVLLVMILPITVQSPVKPVFHPSAPPQTESAQAGETPEALADTETTTIADPPFAYRQVAVVKGIQLSPYHLVIYVWLGGAVVFFLVNIITYLLFCRTIRKHSHPANCPMLTGVKAEKGMKGNIGVRVTQCINTPVILGFLRPTLLLPDIEISDESLRHILWHELIHYQRHDLWYKWLAMTVNAIHWFNPMIYVVIRQINEDCEISCDLAVVQNMNTEERKSYMGTILGMMSYNKTAPPALASFMSGSKGQIKRRFEMLSQQKRINKFISTLSLITAAVIFSATLLAGNVLAAAAQAGLENWTKNEVYYRDGIQFSVNVAGKSVPTWVLEDVAGKDGNVEVTVKRVQIRDVKGEVGDYAILELKGAQGTTRLSHIMASGFHKTGGNDYSSVRIPELLNAAYTSDYSFCEFNNEGYKGYRNSPVASLVTENSGKRKYVNVSFAFQPDESLSSAYVDFLVANEFDNVEYTGRQKYTPVKADSGSIEFIGNFEKDYVFWAKELTSPGYFTFFEKDFVNKKVPGIDMAVDSASTKGITLSASVSHPQVAAYEIFVYNQNERLIASKRDKKTPDGRLVLEPTRYRYLLKDIKEINGDYEDNSENWVYKDVPENQFVSGQTYRVDIILLDQENKVIYRQREYVNMP